jgi:hypothetical protein
MTRKALWKGNEIPSSKFENTLDDRYMTLSPFTNQKEMTDQPKFGRIIFYTYKH